VTWAGAVSAAPASDLISAATLGIPNILLLTGDHPRFGDHPDAKAVFDIDGVQLVWTAATMRDHFAAWADEDRYFPLEAELNALREAGFDEVECFWRRGLCAVTCGLRAS